MKYAYTAIFTEKDGKYYATVPDLDGCVTTGKDLLDVIDQTTDAMACWLCTAEDENIPIPPPTSQSDFNCNKSEILSLIKADTIKYRAETDTKAVRRNVSIPLWLSNLADKRHINCSKVLQEALLSKL